LHNTSYNCNQIKETFKVVSPDPVDQVQRSVAPKSKQIVSCDCFSFSSFADHEQLGKNGNALKVDAEGPQDFQRSEFMVDEECKPTDRNNEEFSTEGVVVSIIGCLELEVNEVHCCIGTRQVNYLHDSVVRRDKVCQQIKISGGENKGKHHLGFS